MQKKRFSVLFITSTFPRNKTDVLANWIGQLAVKLQSKGISVEVIAPSYRGATQAEYMGIVTHRFRYAPGIFETLTHEQGAIFKIRSNPLFILLVPIYLICGVAHTLRVVTKSHYDVVCVHWPFPNGIFGILAKAIGKSRLVLTFHGAEFTLVRQVPFGAKILSFFIKNADKVIANSTFTEREIKKIIPVNVDVIPFGSTISMEKLEKNLNKQAKEKKVKRILYVGRLIERKGVKYLIEAVTNVARDFSLRLDIIGDGPLFDTLNLQISKSKLKDIACIHRDVGTKELETYYRNCDVFVLPAVVDKWGDTEGQGVVLLEALTFKKPVIASAVGGIFDIIQDGKTGLLVPEKNPVELAKAIKQILSDYKLAKQLGENGFRHAINKFSWKKIINETIKAYS